VGRQADLDLLLRWWLACRQERRAAGVCLYGDSGIGKSRLAEELAARCRLDGAATALMRATPADRERPWSGALALARSGLADVSGVGSAAPGALAAFAADLDEWADRFPGARRAAPLPMADALIAAVRAGADEQPIVLVLDDAQWLDSESLLSVGALLRDLAGRAVMVVLTAAPVPAREELDGICGRFGREVPGGVVRLAPLGGESLRELVRWAMPAFSPVEQDRLARRVAADAAGLPLLAVELLHAVGLGLDLHGTTGAWPEEHRTLDQTLPGALPEPVVAAVRMGFRRLSKDAQAVLVAAAVLDDPATPDALARATGLAPDAVLAALDEAEWERWVGADGRGYHFVARLVRDVIARDMVTAGQRQRLRGQR
jgi:predicted ATPase